MQDLEWHTAFLPERRPFGKSYVRAACIFMALLAGPFGGVCRAQQRPLKTQDADLIKPGHTRLQVGFDILKGAKFPLSGLEGDLTRVGVISLHTGFSSRVEVQLAGTVQNFLHVKVQNPAPVVPQLDGERTSDYGDIVSAVKIAILHEKGKRPAVSFVSLVELPISNEKKGIGTNSTNVLSSILVGKHLGRLHAFGNVGMGILESPAELFDQNDVLTYGAAVVHELHRKVNFAAEVQGHVSTRGLAAVGTESRSQARYGLQLFWGGFRWDVAGIVGLTRYEAAHGITFGVSFERPFFPSRRRK